LDLLLPVLVFGVVFGGMLVLVRRSQHGTVARLSRQQISVGGAAVAAAPQARTRILSDVRKSGASGKLAAKFSSRGVQSSASQLLLQAGNPMPVGTFLLLRIVFMLIITPLGALSFYREFGLSAMGIVLILFTVFATPKMPMVYIKRKARKRSKEVERAMPDALDLLVVCVEGGLSLDGGIQQVAQRTEGLLAVELTRLLGEISTGKSRRDALQAMAARSMSESLGALCTTIIQADKMGVSIAATLRTLAETLRTRRRQFAETQARKAPIKMLPFIVFFMLPSLFIIILGPVMIGIREMFRSQGA
jgi:tight adherence protein C